MYLTILAGPTGGGGLSVAQAYWFLGIFGAVFVSGVAARFGLVKHIDDPESACDDGCDWFWFIGVPFGGVLTPLIGYFKNRHDQGSRPLFVEYLKALILLQVMFLSVYLGIILHAVLNGASPFIWIGLLPLGMLWEAVLWVRYRRRLQVPRFLGVSPGAKAE